MSQINRIQGLNGLNPLSYVGVNPYTPPMSVAYGYDPTVNDSKGFTLLAFWLNTANNGVWVLVALVGGLATWVKLSSGSSNIEFLEGNSGGPVGPDGSSIIHVVGDGVTVEVVGTPGTNTLTIGVTGEVATLFDTDAGAASPIAGLMNVFANGGVNNSGSSVATSGSSNIILLNVTDPNLNTIIGEDAGNNTLTGTHNTSLGYQDLLALTSGSSNVSVGYQGLLHITSGSNNVVVGAGAGTAYTSTESNNVVIGVNAGFLAESGTIRIGNPAGTSSTRNMYIGTAAGNLTYAGSDNTAVGYNALHAISGGAGGAFGVGNTAIGSHSMQVYTASVNPITGANTALGVLTLGAMTTGGLNTAIGWTTLSGLTTGNNNTALGAGALSFVTTGSNNIGLSPSSGTNGSSAGVTTGSNNIFVGGLTGSCTYTSSESNNILINNTGVNAESNIMRIGTSGAGTNQVNKAFIAGIRGVTTDAADAIAVLISSTGQLGTVSSSIRYKENVEDMGSMSDAIYDLRPVVFNYQNHSPERKSIGLIAEEVEQVMPDMVIHNEYGEPETVRYHDLPILILNEMKQLLERIEDLEDKLEALSK